MSLLRVYLAIAWRLVQMVGGVIAVAFLASVAFWLARWAV